MTVLNSRPLVKLLSREMYFGIGIRLFSGYFGADTALKYSYTLATSSLSRFNLKATRTQPEGKFLETLIFINVRRLNISSLQIDEIIITLICQTHCPRSRVLD